MLILDAHLEAVLAVDLGEVVGDLDGLADFVRRQEVVAAQVGQIAESRSWADRRFLRPAGMPWIPNCAGMPIVLAVRSVAGGVEVSESGAHLIDRAGVEHVGVGRDHLCGFRGLNPLLEGAAVGYASETDRE